MYVSKHIISVQLLVKLIVNSLKLSLNYKNKYLGISACKSISMYVCKTTNNIYIFDA